ncbi:hypothetical protein GCM10027074_05530 [Streptomyces deserti]
MRGARHTEPTVVVLTALPVEFQAVRHHLTHVEVAEHPQGTLFDVGRVPGLPWRVALAEIGEGNSGAAVHTERAMAFFRPAAVFFVGVAGSLRDDVELGDVVVPSKIYLHHGGKEEDDGFRARPSTWFPLPGLEQRVRRALRDPWGRLPGPGGSAPARVHFKPLVAGDVVLNSRTSRLADLIDRVYNDAVAIDMESAGAAQAAHLNESPALTVRGISDFADGRKRVMDQQGWQSVAARNAAAVAVRILQELPVPRPRPDLPDPPDPPRAPLVVLAPRPAGQALDSSSWRGGATVSVDGERCLLHDGPGDLLAEAVTPGHGVVRRQALARVLPGPAPETARTSRHVWLRQVVASQPGPAAEAALSALSDERDLLHKHRRHWPDVLPVTHHVRRGDTAVLALAWPLSRRSGTPCETLAAVLPEGTGPLDTWRLHRVLHGLARLCRTVTALHAQGLSHRALQPTALILRDDGHLFLRDLGLAATGPEPGEAPGPYQAPEQRRGSRGRPADHAHGATDVYRLGALVHHLLTGTPPVPGMPTAFGAVGPALPSPVTAVLGAALEPAPGHRPGPRELAAALRGLSDHFRAGSV